MRDRYIIELVGCDATTTFQVKINEDIYRTLKEISDFSKQVSSYPCEPVMKIYTLDEWKKIWEGYEFEDDDGINPDDLPLIKPI